MEELLALTDEEQEALLRRLTYHALCKMRNLSWRGAYMSRGGVVPAAYEPYDFALDATQKLLDGTRQWNRAERQTLEEVLKSIIDSDISHLVESVDNIKGRRLAPQSSKEETARSYDLPGREDEDPCKIVIDREWQDQLHKAAMHELDGDGFLQDIFQCLEAEFTKPSEIAVLLGKSIDDVNNGKKRLIRKLEKLESRFAPPKKRPKS
jgi:hypothetical protein